MATKLIQFNDGTLVEVEVLPDQVQPISGGAADRIRATVDETLDKVKPLLLKVCRPIKEVWGDLNQDMDIETAEVQVGLSFEAEGNVYIAKSKASSNLTVKLVLKPKT
ncbi:MAG: CU044_2847 family protein [Leptolyngbyaceae cyanobacterium bins.302]|nr:CU044_2847 family protein [Leptolyngbyaceae cyanobacterium bins.302]